jgi:hypothetical protein
LYHVKDTMGKERNHNSGPGKNSQADLTPNSKFPPLVEEMLAHLKNGRIVEAAKLFLKGQADGIFPPDHHLPEKLVQTIGADVTNRIIVAFAHYPCPFCKKGRLECRDCGGHGHISHEIICERCLGLGIVRCDFCDGSGWMAMRDVPEGLRIAVFTMRAQTALKRLNLIFAEPVPRPSKNKPLIALKKLAQLLVKVDRYMGVLENVLLMADKLRVSEPLLKNKIGETSQRCVEAAAKSKEYVRKIIDCMVVSARLEMMAAENGSSEHELAKKRMEFYKGLLEKSDIFASLSEQHPFLEKAIKKTVPKKPPEKIDL